MSCESKRPVLVHGQPVTGEYTPAWATYLKNTEYSLIAVSRVMEAARDRGVISQPVILEYLDRFATPASLALRQAKDQLVTYEETNDQTALVRLTEHFNTLSKLVADAFAYAAEHGLVQEVS